MFINFYAAHNSVIDVIDFCIQLERISLDFFPFLLMSFDLCPIRMDGLVFSWMTVQLLWISLDFLVISV